MKKKFYSFMLVSLAILGYAQQGGVGIGTDDPQNTLHVKGTLRLEHQTQAKGRFLRVYENGDLKWAGSNFTTALGKRVDGFNSPSGKEIKNQYLGRYVILKPGKWLVKVSQILITYNGQVMANNNAYSSTKDPNCSDDAYIGTFYFSDENELGRSKIGDASKTKDYATNSAQEVVGYLYRPANYGMASGSVIIENTTEKPKTYYLWGKAEYKDGGTKCDNHANIKLSSFGGGWSENKILVLSAD